MMVQEYERGIAQGALTQSAAGHDASGKASGTGSGGGKSEMLFTSGRDALRAVADDLGPWNWILVGPDSNALPIVAGGALSVDEMRESLEMHADNVLFGLVRLSFGVGRLQRTKHVFVHASGVNVSAVMRGRLGGERPKMEQAMKSFVGAFLSMEVTQPEDFTLEEVIGRVRRAAAIDDDILDPDNANKSIYSVEAFRAALEAERESSITGHDPTVAKRSRLNGTDLSIEDVVRLVRAPESTLNWALFGLEKAPLSHVKGSALVASPRPSAVVASPRPSVVTASPRPSLAAASPRPSLITASPRPSVVAASPRPSVLLPSGQPSGGYIAAEERRRASALTCNISNQPAVVTGHQSPRASTVRIIASPHHSAGLADLQGAASPRRSRMNEMIISPNASTKLSKEVSNEAARKSGTPSPPRLTGVLMKQSPAWHGRWQNRYFEVAGGHLRYWHDRALADAGKPPTKEVMLRGAKIERPGNASIFSVKTADRTYTLSLPSSGPHVRVEDWVQALEQECILARKQSLADAGRDLLLHALK
eukprot:gnl/MRDRNA2_/MRDRNA2_31064_c0_seq1.p1 gnl/MRDRNA2_/MRDRNA2_31064_c0~~gnl/MRDRNA2_/MRDRNA2_31064_c0_seq1.p1  ORF type:complete len:536 (+),score=108.36 gnl/MRDRNA2_/MRDRNA2_31064_c0_seq1:510-2117(+)